MGNLLTVLEVRAAGRAFRRRQIARVRHLTGGQADAS